MNKTTCTFCEEPALYETPTNNNYLCESNDCKLQYLEEHLIPLDEDEQEGEINDPKNKL